MAPRIAVPNPRTLPATFLATSFTSEFRFFSERRTVAVEMSMLNHSLARGARRLSHSGTFSMSDCTCPRTRGTIDAISTTISRARSARTAAVASPRRHPCPTSQLTAGSSANDRNSAAINHRMRLRICRTKTRAAYAASPIAKTRMVARQSHGGIFSAPAATVPSWAAAVISSWVGGAASAEDPASSPLDPPPSGGEAVSGSVKRLPSGSPRTSVIRVESSHGTCNDSRFAHVFRRAEALGACAGG